REHVVDAGPAVGGRRPFEERVARAVFRLLERAFEDAPLAPKGEHVDLALGAVRMFGERREAHDSALPRAWSAAKIVSFDTTPVSVPFSKTGSSPRWRESSVSSASKAGI